MTGSPLKSNTSKTRSHSLFRRGCRLYKLIPTMPEHRLALAPLDAAARESLNVPAEVKGVVIAGVRPDSRASEAGLRSGDVLLGVGNQTVATPEDAVKAIGGRDDGKQAVALRVLRDGESLFVAVPVA